jgi:hypothetical protein
VDRQFIGEGSGDCYVSDGPWGLRCAEEELPSADQIEKALAPIIDVGQAQTQPVVDSAAILARVTGEG